MKEKLTVKEAYIAMLDYLDSIYQLTKSDDLGGFLGSMQISKDGSTMDPASWADWLVSVKKIKSKSHKSHK